MSEKAPKLSGTENRVAKTIFEQDLERLNGPYDATEQRGEALAEESKIDRTKEVVLGDIAKAEGDYLAAEAKGDIAARDAAHQEQIELTLEYDTFFTTSGTPVGPEENTNDFVDNQSTTPRGRSEILADIEEAQRARRSAKYGKKGKDAEQSAFAKEMQLQEELANSPKTVSELESELKELEHRIFSADSAGRYKDTEKIVDLQNQADKIRSQLKAVQINESTENKPEVISDLAVVDASNQEVSDEDLRKAKIVNYVLSSRGAREAYAEGGQEAYLAYVQAELEAKLAYDDKFALDKTGDNVWMTGEAVNGKKALTTGHIAKELDAITPRHPDEERVEEIMDSRNTLLLQLERNRNRYAKFLAEASTTGKFMNDKDLPRDLRHRKNMARQRWENSLNKLMSFTLDNLDHLVKLTEVENDLNEQGNQGQILFLKQLQAEGSTPENIQKLAAMQAISEHYSLEIEKYNQTANLQEAGPKSRFLEFWRKSTTGKKFMKSFGVKVLASATAGAAIGILLPASLAGAAAAGITGAVVQGANYGLRSHAKRYDKLTERAAQDASVATNDIAKALRFLQDRGEEVSAANLTGIIERLNEARRKDNGNRKLGSIVLGSAIGAATGIIANQLFGADSSPDASKDAVGVTDVAPPEPSSGIDAVADPDPLPPADPSAAPTPEASIDSPNPGAEFDPSASFEVEAGHGYTQELQQDLMANYNTDLTPQGYAELHHELLGQFGEDYLQHIDKYQAGNELRLSDVGTANWAPGVREFLNQRFL